MKMFFCISLMFIQGLFASHENIDKYLEYMSSANLGKIGDYTKGEMQIVTDYEDILKVQKKYYSEFIKKGIHSEEAKKLSKVGVVCEDKFWIWLRDPLILPNGKTTAYNRFLSTKGAYIHFLLIEIIFFILYISFF